MDNTIVGGELPHKLILAHWLEAIAAFYPVYNQLVTHCHKNSIVTDKLTSKDNSIDQEDCNQLLTMVSLVQTDMGRLLQDLQQPPLLNASINKQKWQALAAHTIALNQMKEQIQAKLPSALSII